ncbi:MAG: bifunctional serine/threonine-protein kinase/universal stress protein [Alphaproteobacteria bacterium]|nr:bifunctional serine/threonine-protein kinase/universal stress protein [Alphaproteobacteria bacterium]
MKLMDPGTELDGFAIGPCIHAGGMAHIYSVTYQEQRESPFDMVMKVPRMTAGDGSENIVGFEVEHQILQHVHGTHVPRFIAAGDMMRLPYLVMEHMPGQTLQQWLDQRGLTRPVTTPFDEIARIGAALAQAVHSLHRQNVCHHDLKPANVLLHPDGRAVLLDFGLSMHAHFPDLLAEEMRKAIGTPAWIAPEQVVGTRGDPRSDVFAIGVILYELLTGELPFGNPQTDGGMRQRLWMRPKPPRALRADTPPWLQEVVLRCLFPQADERYPSAAHLLFDLRHPDQVRLSQLSEITAGWGFWKTLRRWVKAAGMEYQPSPLPAQHQIERVPIVLVALPHTDVSEDIVYSMRVQTERALGHMPGARLAVVTVVSGSVATGSGADSETGQQLAHLVRLQKWTEPLRLEGHQASFHVLESGDVADALLRYAQANEVSMIIMGAATHGLQMQRWMATVPIKVAMQAPCTVMLVKGELPFQGLAELADVAEADDAGQSA